MAHAQIQQTLRSTSIMDPTSELSHFEDRVRREEAMAQGIEEVAASSLDEQFALLGAEDEDREVQDRLAQLKAGRH
ncbi:MAG: phage shock protein [Chloroflexota bacterium]|jgi:phage shock protein A|nr:phage shock protein [Chloroflexota bacterium]